MEKRLKQDLHIHTIFSQDDSSVIKEQTLEMISFANHAEIVGISDHFEMFMPEMYEEYCDKLREFNFHIGTEVNGHASVDMAMEYDFEYYIYHCWGHVDKDYQGLEKLQSSGKPIIVAHPYAIGTDLGKIPQNSIVEINNRYIWRFNWKKLLLPYISKFNWIFSSDAHQPNWLNQQIARNVGKELKIQETILF